jgi:hypothetical protein
MAIDGRIKSIYFAPDKGVPMEQLGSGILVAGKGLLYKNEQGEYVGDRYAEGKGAFSRSTREVIRQISLISSEAIELANERLPEEYRYTEQETRRNIVTEGIDVNQFAGGDVFYIGQAALRGVELCEPCKRPDRLSGKKGFEEAFASLGGLRAQIITGGAIQTGSPIYQTGRFMDAQMF